MQERRVVHTRKLGLGATAARFDDTRNTAIDALHSRVAKEGEHALCLTDLPPAVRSRRMAAPAELVSASTLGASGTS